MSMAGSRETKFQAWHKTQKKMLEVISIDLDPEFGGVWTWGKTYHAYDTGEYEADKDFIEWEHIELREYTGLKDKRGKHIYEGDIVIADWHWTEPHKFKFPDDFYWIQEVSLESDNLEIIGNIYEHPNLLTV